MQKAKIAKNLPSEHHRATLSGHIFVFEIMIEIVIEIGMEQTRVHDFLHNGTPSLLHGSLASAKLCGVEQRATPIFGRAAITLAHILVSNYFDNLLSLATPT